MCVFSVACGCTSGTRKICELFEWPSRWVSLWQHDGLRCCSYVKTDGVLVWEREDPVLTGKSASLNCCWLALSMLITALICLAPLLEESLKRFMSCTQAMYLPLG